MGVYSSSQFLGAFLGGVSGGYLAESLGFSYLFAANAAIALLWFLFATGMQLPASSKRVSIQVEPNPEGDHQSLIDHISQCDGVMEATLVEDENRIYLKVDKKSYDRNRVDQLINEYS
jgi:MFS family permease